MTGSESTEGSADPKTKQTSPTILFDFGGVIVSRGFWNWVETIVPSDDQRAKVTALINAADLGKITNEGFMQELSILFNRPPELVSEQIKSSYTLNEEVVGIIQSLKEQGYQIALVTNFMESRVNALIDRYELRSNFSHIFISSSMGLVKPSLEFFRYVMGELGIKPTQAIFIDDSQININGALEENIQRSWLFTDAQSLKARFQDAQLLPLDTKPLGIPPAFTPKSLSCIS